MKNRLPTRKGPIYDVPFVGVNTARSVGGQRALFVAVLEVGDGFLCIEHQIGLNQVVLFVAKKGSFPHFMNITQDDLSEVTSDLKSKALERGATLEAIQLLGTLTELTREEEAEMANPKAAAAAKNAKLSKKTEAPAKKGNGEALAAARAARASANDGKKIKVLKKDHGAREGSKRAQMLDIVLGAKTVAEAKAAGAGWIDVKFAEESGFIALS